MMNSIETWIIPLLAIMFVFAGGMKFHKRTLHDAERWELSWNFLRVVGVVEIAAAVALFWYPYWASGVLLVIMSGALGVGVRGKNYKELIHPGITAALLAFVLLRNL